jgi:DnaJ-domain-containing protein 1
VPDEPSDLDLLDDLAGIDLDTPGSDDPLVSSGGHLFDRPRPQTGEASDDDEPRVSAFYKAAEARISYVPLEPELIDLTDEVEVDPAVAAAEAKRYTDWADRMRMKRQRDQAHIRGVEFVSLDEAANWSADTVIGQSDVHEIGDPSRPADPARVTDALGLLGLEPGASADQVALAYRELAKQHHPDRWAGADESTQRLHAEEMMRVNSAYTALRRELSR